ncbi:Aldo/keto reductase [Crucibulum laeve]|uniref:Aldo/keto reductase n=1 Tax=Crucibulum laeve TaxID=68775 RepID=A0A5C3MG44_9AGAR|nr:Aldo/keto reductase [Crucibulum laeve]
MALSLKSTVRLPGTGQMLPLLGFGVYQNYTTKDSCLGAFKTGYRHVDSAQMYRNEAEVGEALREAGLQREEVFVTSKVGSKNHGYEKTLKGIDESLQRFKFDYIDLFLIHDPYSGTEKRIETWKALIKAKQDGKLKNIGVSNYGVKHLEEIKNAGLETPVVNQIELHPLCQQRPIVEYCQKHNIIVQAYCPIIRGKLDIPIVKELAKKYNKDGAQILIRWSLQRGFVPLPKSATPSRIQSNAQVYDFELTDEEVRKLDELDQGKAGAYSWNPVDAE